MTDSGDRERLEQELRSLRRSVDDLTRLNELGRALGANFEADEINRIIIRQSSTAVDASQATITMVDSAAVEPSGTLVREVDGIDTPHIHLDRSLVRYMMANPRPFLANDPLARNLPAGVEVAGGVRSLVCAPLLVGSRLIGVLTAYNKHDGANFDTEDLRMLSIMAAQSAQVLERARLLQEEQAAARIREEVRVAARIQTSLLPEEAPQIAGYDIHGLSNPAREVGGDYYDFIDLEDGRWGITVGDVSGKGVPAAMLMANLQATLRSQAVSRAECRDCVGQCNRLLFRSSSPEKFVTLFYGVLDPSAHTLTYTNGGHEHPLLVRAAGGIERLDMGGLPAGVLESYDYDQGVVELSPGDAVIVFSDGVTDMENPREEPFGEERLLEVVVESSGRPARELAERIETAVRKHAGGTAPFDDETLLVLRRMPD